MIKKIILHILVFLFLPFPLFASVFPVGVLVNQQTHRGKSIVEALKLAAQELKVYKSKSKSGFEVKLFIEDTRGIPKVALSKLESFAAKGIHTVIGPQSSEEAEDLLNFTKKKNMTLISPSSTAVKLAKTGDSFLRFCPDDRLQAVATAKLMDMDRVRSVVVVYRDDEWGQNVAQAIKKNFLANKGNVVSMISYDPASENFSKLSALILTAVSSASEKHGRNATAVVILGYREVAEIFYAARRYSVLERVKWYGSDASFLSKEIIADRDAAEFAAKTNYRTPVFGGNPSNAAYRSLKSKLQARFGQEPDIYAMAAYDALRVAALAYQQTGDVDAKVFRDAVEKVADSHQGTTGPVALNKAGDRRNSDYDFWSVRKTKGKYTQYTWKLTGRFSTKNSKILSIK